MIALKKTPMPFVGVFMLKDPSVSGGREWWSCLHAQGPQREWWSMTVVVDDTH